MPYRMIAAVLAALLVVACSGQRGPVSEAVAGLRVVDHVPDVPGYDRGCGRDEKCVFGPAWSDDVDVQFGRNGCDQRSDVYRRQMTGVRIKPGSRGCVVVAGELDDPYTGQHLSYRRGDPAQPVELDHVFALSAAWDRGAAEWTLQQRRNLAGDPRNLIATSSAANAAKGDKNPASWSPATRAGQCVYARRYVDVAVTYRLSVTRSDQARLEALLAGC